MAAEAQIVPKDIKPSAIVTKRSSIGTRKTERSLKLGGEKKKRKKKENFLSTPTPCRDFVPVLKGQGLRMVQRSAVSDDPMSSVSSG